MALSLSWLIKFSTKLETRKFGRVITVKPVLSCHSKIGKTKVLKTNGSLMQVKCIAECSLGAFCNKFDLHSAIIGLKKHFCLHFEWLLKTGFTVYILLGLSIRVFFSN